MRVKTPVVADLSWQQVHAFRLAGHHLAKRGRKKDLARVVGDIGGAQAQVMSAAELQVAVRVDCKVEDVRSALWKDKSLVKTWLMRGTLHLVPSRDLPIYAAAMGRHRIQNINAWLKFTQLTEPELMGLFTAIGDALDGRTLTREELISSVGRGRSEKVRNVLKSGWGSMLKPVARNGLLCFGPGGASHSVAGCRTTQNHRASHAIYRAHRPLVECGPPGPRSFRSPSLEFHRLGKRR